MECEKCHKKIAPTWRFCPFCNADLAVSQLLCPNKDCRKPLEKGFVYCPFCGTEAIDEDLVQKCPRCNFRMIGAWLFCPACGYGAALEQGKAGCGSLKVLYLPDGNEITMVFIPAGQFEMGDDKNRHADEKPQHKVTIKKPFFLGQYPITQGQLKSVMGGSFSGDPRLPAVSVTWLKACEFCKKLSELFEGKYLFRLPSEAEWEYACRAGTTTEFYTGADLTKEQANFSSSGLKRVGSFPPNPWNLYDMHGNVWEWCQDAYASSYKEAPTDGSAFSRDDPNKVCRGGAWSSPKVDCRSPNRQTFPQNIAMNDIGFRIVAVELRN